MRKQESADDFSRDVDGILADASQEVSVDKRQAHLSSDIDVARLLMSADFSSESRIKKALRTCLVKGMDTRELSRLRKMKRKETFMRAIRHYIWRPLPTAALAAILLAVFVIPVLWPGALSATAQNVDTAVQRLVVGKSTTIVQIEPEKAPPAGKQPETQMEMWFVNTPIAGFGGNVPEGKDAAVRYYCNFQLAQKQVPDVKLLYPSWIPAGYYLREALVPPVDGVILTFSHGTGQKPDIILAEQSVGETRQIPTGQAVTARTSVTVTGDAPLRSITVNGNRAAWMSGGTLGRNSLHWEVNGISFTAGGIGMKLEDAVRLAESLK